MSVCVLPALLMNHRQQRAARVVLSRSGEEEEKVQAGIFHAVFGKEIPAFRFLSRFIQQKKGGRQGRK